MASCTSVSWIPGTEQLGGAHHAIGSRGYRRSTQKFLFAAEKIKFPLADATLPYETDNLPGGNSPRIRHIVDSKGNTLLPTEQTGFHKLLQFRDGIRRVQEAFVAHQLG